MKPRSEFVLAKVGENSSLLTKPNMALTCVCHWASACSVMAGVLLMLVQHRNAAKWRSMLKFLESAMPRRPILVPNTVVAGVACFAPCHLFVTESNSRQRFPSPFCGRTPVCHRLPAGGRRHGAEYTGPKPKIWHRRSPLKNLDLQIANIQTATRQQDRVIARSELLPQASFGR